MRPSDVEEGEWTQFRDLLSEVQSEVPAVNLSITTSVREEPSEDR